MSDLDRDYPVMAAETDRFEPCPRRVRAYLGGAAVLDSTRARYVWEWPYYPQFYFPAADLDSRYLVDEKHEQRLRRGPARRYGLRVGDVERPGCLRIYGDDAAPAVAGYAHLDWEALDAWFEEDEEVFVHPRNPYVRVDALRSHRSVRVELDGVLLAESATPVLVFETGLPTRYYLDRTDVDLTRLSHTDTSTACPYKGVTSDYWSARLADPVPDEHRDIAWSYAFPTRQLLPIAGLVAFYNEKVDIVLDGVRQGRPNTHFV